MDELDDLAKASGQAIRRTVTPSRVSRPLRLIIGVVAGALVLSIVLLTYRLYRRANGVPDSISNQHLINGDTGYLSYGSHGLPVYVARSSKIYVDFVRCTYEPTHRQIDAMTEAEQLILVPDGTACQIVGHGIQCSEIRIIEGKHAGHVGWVGPEDIKRNRPVPATASDS